MALACESCDEKVDEGDMEDGMCPACFEVSGGAKYCCGAIYEDGEDTCRSCGEPL